MSDGGLEFALRMLRHRASRRREDGSPALLALELDLAAQELARALAAADTSRIRVVRCPKCRTVVKVSRQTQ